MKKNLLLLLIVLMAANSAAQAPQNYYALAQGKQGAALKSALSYTVFWHKVLEYDALWEAFKTTDVTADGFIWDMYSDTTHYVPGGPAQGANMGSSEGNSYNREHSLPKSWFGGMDAYPMSTDLQHIYPTDSYINSRHNNLPFGETAGEIYMSYNGFSKLGNSTLADYTGKVFEPNDRYKGDLARAYFHMVTAYEDQVAAWSSDMMSGDRYSPLSAWALNMLLRWAKNDPVDEKERSRNEAIYLLQGNRNPFIDCPGLEAYIWGDSVAVPFDANRFAHSGGVVQTQSLPDAAGQIFRLVTSSDDLVSGKRYLVVSSKRRQTLGSSGGHYYNAELVSVASDQTIDLRKSHSAPTLLRLAGDASGYVLHTDYGVLLCNNSNTLSTGNDSTAANARWTISFSGDQAVIAGKVNSDRSIRYNSSAQRFSTYTNYGESVMLYVQTDDNPSTGVPAPPYFSPSGGTISAGTAIVITTTTTGASIAYSINGSEETVAPAPVQLVLNEAATITARSLLDGKYSTSRTATYTVAATPPAGDGIYRRVNTTADLIDGEEYLIVCESSSVALGAQSSTYRLGTSVVLSEGYIDLSGATTTPTLLRIAALDDHYTLLAIAENAYLACTGATTTLTTAATAESDKEQWSITLSDGNAIISPKAVPGRAIAYNATPTVPRFALYVQGGSTGKPVSLYVRHQTGTGLSSAPSLSSSTTPAVVYDLQGRRVARPRHGLYILNGKKVMLP